MKKLILILSFLLISSHVYASDIEHYPESDLVRCIVGEAADQGPHGMLVIASAIRNRGTLQGVAGCSSDLVYESPKFVVEAAYYAWLYSEFNDYARGCTEWRSTRIGEDAWPVGFNDLVYIFAYKDHKFYRLIKQKGD